MTAARAVRIIATDVETTGLDPTLDRIVEFSFLSCDERLAPTETWTERVNPGMPIPRVASDLHGIRDADVADRPTFSAFADRVEAALRGAVVIGHNGRFDLDFYHNELVRAGKPGLPADVVLLDTAELERTVNSHRLGPTFRRYTGRELSEGHSAEADAKAALEVLRHQLRIHARSLGTLNNQIARNTKRWLDSSRKLFADGNGVACFGFGKYSGEPIARHLDYLEWMAGADFPPDTIRLAKRLLKESRV